MRGILQIESRIRNCLLVFDRAAQFLNSGAGVLVIIAFIVVTKGLYFLFISRHALFAEDGKVQGVIGTKWAIRDRMIHFHNKRWIQLIKLNYILYSRNRNCRVSKLMFCTVWIVLVCYCRNISICFYFGLLAISLISTLVLYRIRDEKHNSEIYESFGYTPWQMFWNHCICGFVYLYNFMILGVLIAGFTGGMQLRELLRNKVCKHTLF